MLRVHDLTVRYGTTAALAAVTIDMEQGSTVAVMGESGSGKSTLLRAIAGLVTPSTGSIQWNGTDLAATPAHQRRFGLMFQDYALFPHLSVGENVAFGLRMAGVATGERTRITDRHLSLVGLSGYGHRPVDELSGGEQQRVALARTLASDPQLVLLDEPLGALDRSRRDQLMADMQRIFADSGVGAIYVTHDHHEAFAVADQIAVLHNGELVRQGRPDLVWNEPGHEAVATLLGFPIASIAVHDGIGSLGAVSFPLELSNGQHTVALSPAALKIDAEGDLDVDVVARRFEGGVTVAVIETAGQQLTALAPHGVRLGATRATVDSSLIRLLAD